MIQSRPDGVKFRQISKQIDEHPQDIMEAIHWLITQRKVVVEYNDEIKYVAVKERKE